MTPKEKAKELTEKMFNVDLNCSNESMCMLYPHALLCALIAAENIRTEMVQAQNYERAIYWRDVKSQIKML